MCGAFVALCCLVFAACSCVLWVVVIDVGFCLLVCVGLFVDGRVFVWRRVLVGVCGAL